MTTTETPAITAFEVGQTVQAASACDSDCIWTFEVIARTAAFITLRELNGETVRVKVRTHGGEEWASPFGTYSLAPVVRAGR